MGYCINLNTHLTKPSSGSERQLQTRMSPTLWLPSLYHCIRAPALAPLRPAQPDARAAGDGRRLLWGSIREKRGRDGAGEIMEAPAIGDKQPHQRSAECLCRKRNKRAKGTAWQRNKKTQWLSCFSPWRLPSGSCDL